MARILIIEDDKDIAEMYRQMVEETGNQVVDVVASAGAANRSPRIDLILLDERLQDGLGTASLGDLHRTCPNARILLLTADAEAASNAKGIDGALVKPFPLDQLGRLMARVLKQPRRDG